MAGVAERCETARQMGVEMFHPGVEVGEVRERLARGQGAYLTESERDAYDRLMPGTFWASFQAGWNTARSATAGG